MLVDEGPRRTRAYPALLYVQGSLLLAWETHEAGVHRIRFARLPAHPDGKGNGDGIGPPETVVEGERGVFFPTLAVEPRSGRLYLAWQAVSDARRYRVEVAARPLEGGRWTKLRSALKGIEDGRFPMLGSAWPGEGVPLVFVSRSGRASELYRISLKNARLEGPVKLSSALPHEEKLAAYTQALIAFPTVAGGLVVWGHTVPDACGTGPLFWAWGNRPSSPPRELIGEFASYPHVIADPREPRIFHLV